MVNIKLMTKKEIEWLNSHNKRCLNLVGPHLNAKQKQWLERECKPLGKHWIGQNRFMKIFATGAAAALVVTLVYAAQRRQ